MEVFETTGIGSIELKNRIFRSATFEGMCDNRGFPTTEYYEMYETLARNEIGGIITGFAYISEEGKAMQPGQAGIDNDNKTPYYQKLTDIVHKYHGKIFMQIAHTGRQTQKSVTGKEVVGCSTKKSIYFNEKPRVLTTDEVYQIIDKFGNSARYAKESGFDGIQLHAAHGYLIHQFLLPSVNKRQDEFIIDKRSKIGTRFLDLVIDNVRAKCGDEFPVLIKISGSDDYYRKFDEQQLINLIQFFNTKKLSAIEISYGTMDFALNIFRGGLPVDLILSRNPIFNSGSFFSRFLKKTIAFNFFKVKLKPYSPMYNLDFASIAKKHTTIPIISVGGFRTFNEIEYAIKDKRIDFVSLCRPFIAEPDFVIKLMHDRYYKSLCVNCNYCAIMCDTNNRTMCYKNLQQ
ncbi:MAG: NADH:flavin oxidoreductase [Bacteroidales bacterium]|nr:NADH:flavin oxidoreductase [Bacteroidales bacterium]